MTPDFISVTLHLDLYGLVRYQGGRRGGWGGVCVHVAFLIGAGIKPFTGATLWIISLTTLRVEKRGGGQKVCPFVHFKTIFERNI